MDLDSQKITAELIDFVRKAGALAVEKQSSAGQMLKADKSVVTETDLAISKMCHEHFADYLALDGHILVDEETIDEIGTPAEVMAENEYLWVIDPIDGTANYAAGLPLYGVMIGVLKNGAPWLGVIYLPALNELFYADGSGTAYIVKNAFSDNAKTSKLACFDGELHGDMPCSISGNMVSVDKSIMQVTINCSCFSMSKTVQGCFPAMMQKAKFWDLAPCWAIAKGAGATLRYHDNNEELLSFTPNWLDNKWSFKRHYITAREKYIELVRNAFTLQKLDKQKVA